MTRRFAAVLIAATCIGGCGENDAAHARMKSQGHLARGDRLVRSTANPAQSLRIIETTLRAINAPTRDL